MKLLTDISDSLYTLFISVMESVETYVHISNDRWKIVKDHFNIVSLEA